MRNLALTDEQADWLEKHLDGLLTNDSWAGSGPGASQRMSDDGREHATAIQRKVVETKPEPWGH